MRRRLVLAIAGVAAAAVILFALPLAVVIGRSYRDQELSRLQRDTVAATREIDLGAANADPVELPPSRDVLAVYDNGGARVAGRGPARADALALKAVREARPVEAEQDGQLRVAVPLLVKEQVRGVVRGTRSGAAVARRTRWTWLALAGLALFVVSLAGLAAVLLARRLVRPLERLAASARKLGEGDFAARAPRADMPELDHVAEALDSTADRLGELVSRERSFSSNASHQLRTPLTALRIELEGLDMAGGGSAQLTAALGQVDRLQATVDTLLALARDAPVGDGGRRVELATLLDEAEARWRGPLAAAGRPLAIEMGPTGAQAMAAPAVLREILDVLLDNALAHGSGVVTMGVRDAGRGLAIDVSDEGAGFEGDPERAFTRRASGGDAGGGHGIGLALARDLALADGCRLVVTRAFPKPIVTVLLPRPPGG
jgi:signal transduction histidine kinase